MNNNEIEIIDSRESAVRFSKGDKVIELSPEVSQQICNEMINLGTQLIAETGKVTVEYFRTQADMYYSEINAYISDKTLKSNERKEFLKNIEYLTDKYVDLINQTDDSEKREQLKSAYEFFVDKQSKMYMEALAVDLNAKSPQKIDLIGGFKNLFCKK